MFDDSIIPLEFSYGDYTFTPRHDSRWPRIVVWLKDKVHLKYSFYATVNLDEESLKMLTPEARREVLQYKMEIAAATITIKWRQWAEEADGRTAEENLEHCSLLQGPPDVSQMRGVNV